MSTMSVASNKWFRYMYDPIKQLSSRSLSRKKEVATFWSEVSWATVTSYIHWWLIWLAALNGMNEE